MNSRRNKIMLTVSVLFLAISLFGCAGTRGSIAPVTQLKEGEDLSKYSGLVLEVQNNADVALTPGDRERILTHIIANLHKEYPARFKEINSANQDPSKLQVIVNVVRYDKGSAFGRFMLAGVGAMHIDADIILNDSDTKQFLAKYECKKTFAWGGLYGGSTKIEDIEEGFAKAVATAIVEGHKKQE